MSKRNPDLRVRGQSLGARFVLSTTISLALVMAVAGIILSTGTTHIADNVLAETLSGAAMITPGLTKKAEADPRNPPYEEAGRGWESSGVEVYPIRYRLKDGGPQYDGFVYRYRVPPPPHVDPEEVEPEYYHLYVPSSDKVGRDMLGMIVAIMIVVVVVGAVASLLAAKQVSRPIHQLVDDVRQIAKGNLQHRTRAVGVGEVELLARSIDRMTSDLNAAQGAQVELSIREREMSLAGGVREALLPLATPLVDGYDLGAAHLGAASLGGDFHDFVEMDDGRVGLLVCDVSGRGVPAALIGATARSYLRSELTRSDDIRESFLRINRWLAQDVRRGMYVTALYVLLDPRAATAAVVCAGHKIPLLRYTSADGKLRVVHPEGIALGFDKGPVFERRLELQEVPIEAGDRLFLCNSAPVGFANAAGRELGEKAFFGRVLKHGALDTGTFLKALKRDLEQFVGPEGVPSDVSLVTISRVS